MGRRQKRKKTLIRKLNAGQQVEDTILIRNGLGKIVEERKAEENKLRLDREAEAKRKAVEEAKAKAVAEAKRNEERAKAAAKKKAEEKKAKAEASKPKKASPRRRKKPQE